MQGAVDDHEYALHVESRVDVVDGRCASTSWKIFVLDTCVVITVLSSRHCAMICTGIVAIQLTLVENKATENSKNCGSL
jgi:hypothetical protein